MLQAKRHVRTHHGLLGLLALILLLACLLPQRAQAGRPVIVPGREAEIAALFAPHHLGDELADGWSLHSFSIDRSTIHVWLADPQGEPRASLDLDHPDYPQGEARALPGFAATILEEPPGSEAAVEALLATVAGNDQGEFWGRDPVLAEEPVPVDVGDAMIRAKLWARDGALLLTALVLGLLALVWRKLGDDKAGWLSAHELGERAPADPPLRRRALLLAAIVLGGAGLRLALSPATVMAPWPYSRLLISAGLIYDSPLLASLVDEPRWLAETVLTSTLLLALLAPLAVYVHARYLLAEQRAALMVAALVAVLPLHLRFSHSDAAFIPSITVSSLCFTLIHVATRDPSRRWGWAAVLLLGPPLALVFLVRPLNVLYVPLLLATAFVNEGLYRSKPAPQRSRMLAAFAVVLALGLAVAVPNLRHEYASEVSEGLGLETLRAAAGVLFSFRDNALLNPEFTPPGLTALAMLGAVDLWRRGRRRLAAFLLLWLLGFLVAHGYVVPMEPYMQARYHLHLIVPYMLLVAAGLEASLRWLRDTGARAASPEGAGRWSWLQPGRARLAAAALLAYGLASPLLHLHFIRAVDFNDQREWSFVLGLRQQIPADCTIIEYSGRRSGLRFERVGAYTIGGDHLQRWPIVEIPLAAEGEPELPPEVVALLQDPPACTYWYEGLPCWGNKPAGTYRAPACDAIVGFQELEEVAAVEFESRAYDENLAVDLDPGQPLRLALYRLRRREPGI